MPWVPLLKTPISLPAKTHGISAGARSSASAAAVAASEALYALDSDTGGALRQSASFCGVVGLKPTYGRVSRFGLAATASSMDTVGPIAKNVKDCAIVLNAISGIDSFDPTSSDAVVPDFLKSLESKPEGAKIGIPKEFFGDEVAEDVKSAVINAAKTFENLGYVCEEISLPHAEYALWAYLAIVAVRQARSWAYMTEFDTGIGHKIMKA